MGDFNQFARRMRELNAQLGSGAIIRGGAIAASGAVIRATPVDTGVARSNWQVELDRPASGVIPAHAPGQGLGSGEAANAQTAIDLATERIRRYDPARHQEIHLTNNAPYIGRLNNGSSAQAPRNFVRRAVTEATRAIRAAARVTIRSRR
jgi:hypothetical protein